jgi:MFS family permease
MIQQLTGRTRQIGKVFSVVQGNARVIVITEGISSVFFQWYGTYLTLYMLALGVSEIEVGLLTSLLIFTQLISTLFGGYVADRFGRKLVLVVADIVCWGVPFALYAVAQNPWYFVIGRFINGFIYIVMPAFDCLFVEDVEMEHRPAVFGMNQLLNAAASLLAPVAGVMVSAWGMVPAGRVMMASAGAVAVIIAIVRLFTLKETSVGRERMSQTAQLSPGASIREYSAAVVSMVRDQKVRQFLIVRNLAAFATTMWATYAVIYLADAKGVGLHESIISLIPFVSSLATILMILLAADGYRSDRIYRNLLIGQVLWLASAVIFLASPQKTIWFALVATFLSAIYTALYTPASSSYWANIVGDHERAQVFSASSTILSLLTLPAAPLAGLLYLLWPRAPFCFAAALQLVVLGMLVGMWKKESGEQRVGKRVMSNQ